MTSNRLIWGGVGLAAACLASLATADAPVPKRPAALQAVVDCRRIDDSVQRLSCYDAAVGQMTKAEDSGDLVSIDRAQRRAVRRQAFGFAMPSLAIFDRGEKPEEVDRLEETLADAHTNSEGRWVFVMQDGAIWRQTDDNDLPLNPHPGSKIVIKRGALGSFMLNVDGQRGLKVHRDG